MTVDIAENSATGQKKFTARQWVALIGFSGVETRKQIQNIWKQIRKDCDATEVRTIVVTAIKEQKLTLTDNPAQFGMATMWQKKSINSDSPTYRWKT